VPLINITRGKVIFAQITLIGFVNSIDANDPSKSELNMHISKLSVLMTTTIYIREGVPNMLKI
jgi:hypothetical protein